MALIGSIIWASVELYFVLLLFKSLVISYFKIQNVFCPDFDKILDNGITRA